MEKQELLDALDELHAELAKSEKSDPETLARLRAVTRDIEKLEPPIEPQDATEPHGLRELLLRFESEHPQLSETLGRIADGLARMGI